jgi:UPF0755 protein
MPRRGRASFLSCFSLVVASLLCLGVFFGAIVLLYLPSIAAYTFGPPVDHLSSSHKIRLSAQLLWQADDLTHPLDPSSQPRPFEIPMGDSIPSIAERLQQQGLIRDASAFRAYLVYAGLDTTLQAGSYQLSPAMTAVQIAHSLQDATPAEVTFNILSGWRAEELAASLPTSGLRITPEDFLAALLTYPRSHPFLESLPPAASLEGFLSPGPYRFSREAGIADLLAAFLDRFERQLTSEILQAFENQGLTVFEAVILASIVERESVVNAEMPLIASVFLNRLAISMKLDADSTVQYALGYNEIQNTWWTNPLSAADLQIDSPYNTYRYPGLPPGPIANPSLEALQAVAFPPQSPYYYFRAACDGSGEHLFAETYDEHVRNACP